jgi:hypothetical protein
LAYAADSFLTITFCRRLEIGKEKNKPYAKKDNEQGN